MDVIYLDITKAFDTVSHSRLLYKLSMFNIGGELWSWFLAYVTNRSQFVSINGCNSDLLPVESRVPQGSILGPSLFIIYMNDIPSVAAHSKVFLFADDTKCFKHIKIPSNNFYNRIWHVCQIGAKYLSCHFIHPKALIFLLKVKLQLLITLMTVL